MEHDYYQILAVARTADLDAIKKAYRRKVMVCHPDRGGSHQQMLMVNEAWEVLSNLELRSRYDAARTNTTDRTAQQAAEADAQAARQRAEQYPPRWKEVEAWLNGLAGDFTIAKHDMEMEGWIPYPKIEGGRSGGLFMLSGTILSIYFFSPIVYDAVFKIENKGNLYTYIIKYVIVIFMPFFAGMWAGFCTHWLLSKVIKAGTTNKTMHSDADQSSTSEIEPRIIECERCNQKLRVPAMRAELLVTCNACGYKFGCPPT